MRAASVALLLAFALTGCAVKTRVAVHGTAPAANRAAGGVSYGTVLVERPVALGAGNDGVRAVAGPAAGGDDVRSSILAAIGDAGPSGLAGGGTDDETSPGGATEFIVRVDDGRTISVVQGGTVGLKPGARVMIIHGADTRIAPEAQS